MILYYVSFCYQSEAGQRIRGASVPFDHAISSNQDILDIAHKVEAAGQLTDVILLHWQVLRDESQEGDHNDGHNGAPKSTDPAQAVDVRTEQAQSGGPGVV